MNVIEDLRTSADVFENVVLTLGSFDGVHLGHQAIIQRLVAAARHRKARAAIMTLRPHPQSYFRPDDPPQLLTSDPMREAIFAELGVDLLFYLPFDDETAALDREAFLQRILLERCAAAHLVIGYDLRFGKQALGDYAYLESRAPEKGFTIERVDPVMIDGVRISSTAVREALAAGDLDSASRMLGRPYRLCGRVVEGRGLGRKIGFPTANIAPEHSALPADGIYAAVATVDNRRYKAAVNVGYAPTLAHDQRTVEAHLLDFDGDLRGKPIALDFRQRVRPEKRFESVDALIAAIAADVAAIRAMLDAELSP